MDKWKPWGWRSMQMLDQTNLLTTHEHPSAKDPAQDNQMAAAQGFRIDPKWVWPSPTRTPDRLMVCFNFHLWKKHAKTSNLKTTFWRPRLSKAIKTWQLHFQSSEKPLTHRSSNSKTIYREKSRSRTNSVIRTRPWCSMLKKIWTLLQARAISLKIWSAGANMLKSRPAKSMVGSTSSRKSSAQNKPC